MSCVTDLRVSHGLSRLKWPSRRSKKDQTIFCQQDSSSKDCMIIVIDRLQVFQQLATRICNLCVWFASVIPDEPLLEVQPLREQAP
eukprot:757613-Hanusia_phi.AAC.4